MSMASYGDTTVAAVKAFQKKYNLTADGVAGSETLKEARQRIQRNADSDKDDDSLRKGAAGSAVKDSQTKLKKSSATTRRPLTAIMAIRRLRRSRRSRRSIT